MTTNDIPTGMGMATVLDRMKRASNFASNGGYFIENDPEDPMKTAHTYIDAAQRMLDEARDALPCGHDCDQHHA